MKYKRFCIDVRQSVKLSINRRTCQTCKSGKPKEGSANNEDLSKKKREEYRFWTQSRWHGAVEETEPSHDLVEMPAGTEHGFRCQTAFPATNYLK